MKLLRNHSLPTRAPSQTLTVSPTITSHAFLQHNLNILLLAESCKFAFVWCVMDCSTTLCRDKYINLFIHIYTHLFHYPNTHWATKLYFKYQVRLSLLNTLANAISVCTQAQTSFGYTVRLKLPKRKRLSRMAT